MFNLLPDPEKKQILDEYNFRRITVALAFLFAVGLIAIIAIFPAFELSMSKVADAQNGLNAIKNSPVFQEEASLETELGLANSRLSALRPPATEVDAAALFQSVISHKTPNVRLSGFVYTKGSGTVGGKLTVSGIARSREDLSALVDSLKTDPLFTRVDLPVSSFAKDQNADFSLNLSGAF